MKALSGSAIAVALAGSPALAKAPMPADPISSAQLEPVSYDDPLPPGCFVVLGRVFCVDMPME